MKAWYLIQSKSRQENVAKENLERQGYFTYLPVINLRRRNKGRTVRAVGPMFPRYLFIQLSDKTDNWQPIRSTIGVSSLVKFGQIAARVPNVLIENLKFREDEQGSCVLPEPNYMDGEKVRIAEGPFEGYEAIFKSKTASDRVSILIQVVQKNINIELDQRVIERLG